jgi:hypothetical protein
MSVTQHRTDLGERRALAQHLSGQSVTKLMRSASWGIDPCTLEAMANNRSNATCTSEAANGGFDAQKNPATDAAWSPMPQIRCDCLANVGR